MKQTLKQKCSEKKFRQRQEKVKFDKVTKDGDHGTGCHHRRDQAQAEHLRQQPVSGRGLGDQSVSRAVGQAEEKQPEQLIRNGKKINILLPEP